MRSFLVLFIALLVAAPAFAQDAAKETAFDRITRTGVIRCGYLIWPPSNMKDPNTGKMSGIMVDYVEALGKSLNLKIDWTTELNLGTYIDDLNTGRIDMECSGGWPNALRGKKLEYSMPVYYFPFYAYARIDDTRFDNNYGLINSQDVKVATADGGTDEILRLRRFPQSTQYALPQISSAAERYIAVATKKADIVFMDPASFVDFDRENPSVLKKVEGKSLRVIPNNLSFAAGEYRLQQMINTATNELIYDGAIDRILDQYSASSHPVVLRVLPTYQE